MARVARLSWALSSVVALVFAAAHAACGDPTSAAAGGPGATDDDAGTSQDVDGGSPGDGASPLETGAPSNVYPAPHPPLPDSVNGSGGPVLTTPKAVLVFYPGYPFESQLETFAQDMTQSTYWSTTTSEYGVGPITYGGSMELTGETAPMTITDTALRAWVASELQSGKLGTPDQSAMYTFFFPQSTTISQTNPLSFLIGPQDSCVAFGGYHDSVSVAIGGGTPKTYAYVVMPTCGGSVDALTAVASHEWVEAATDPFLTWIGGGFSVTGGPTSAFYSVDSDHSVWALLGGGEVGDLCENETNIYVTPTDLHRQAQRTWSNVLARASHDPCTPNLPGVPYFNSAPVLDETVTFTSPFTGSVTTKGVTVAVGQSKTVEVDLFSDADTGGPWTVTADDYLATRYNVPSTMIFDWDRSQGQNGEKLHLTITVTSGSILNGGHVFVITSKKGLRQTVWPGLVLEP